MVYRQALRHLSIHPLHLSQERREMITAFITIACIVTYLAGAALAFRKFYIMAYETAIDEYRIDGYRLRPHDYSRAGDEGSAAILPAMFWPVTLPFILAMPVPPSLKVHRQQLKNDREEKALLALERAAGIR